MKEIDGVCVVGYFVQVLRQFDVEIEYGIIGYGLKNYYYGMW